MIGRGRGGDRVEAQVYDFSKRNPQNSIIILVVLNPYGGWVRSSGWDPCSGTTKVRNSGLGPDPDLSAKSGPE